MMEGGVARWGRGARGGRGIARLLTVAIVLVALALPVEALADSWTLGPEGKEYALDIYASQDGLPQNSVNDILRSRDGYLWIATFGGVARFDGVRFEVFDVASAPGIGSNRIMCLHQSGDGAIWMGHQDGRLTRYADGEFHTFTSEDGGPSTTVWRIREGDDGTLWLATPSGVFLLRPDGTFESLPDGDGVSTRGSFDLLMEADTVWIAQSDTVDAPGSLLSYRDGHLKREANVLSRGSGVGFGNLLRDERGRLWLGTKGGAWQFLDDGRTLKRIPGNVARIGRDNDGNLWIVGAEILRLGAGEPGEPFSRPLGSPLPFPASAFLVDHEGSIWIGTRGGGLLRLRPRTLKRFTREDGLPGREIRTVTGDGSGGLWLTGQCTGFARYRDGRFETLHEIAGVEIDCAGASLVDRDGTLWLGNDGLLCSLGENRSGCRDTNDYVGAIHQDRSGRVWVAMNGGLGYVDGDGLTTIPAPQEIGGAPTQALVEDRAGTLWIGTTRGLLRFADGEYERMSSTEEVSVRDIHEDPDGVLWIGTYGHGLGRLAGNGVSWITTREGLRENFISRILADDRGNLWLNGNRGVSHLARSEIEDLVEGRGNTVFPVLLGERDGGAEGNGGAQPAGWKTEDGRLWFPTIDGLVMVDPSRHEHSPAPPPVVIESVAIDGETLEPNGPIRIPPEAHAVEIRYTALSLLRPAAVRFRFRLEGHDDQWTEAGSRRTAYYTGAPAGTYTFRVIAASDKGAWTERGAAIELTFVPPFWATWWFRTLAIVALVAAAVAVVRIRTTAIRKRSRALAVEIEQRAAAEARLRSVIDHAPVVLFALDREGRFTFSEGRGLAALGLEPGEAVGRSAFEMYADEEGIVEYLRAGLAGEEREWTARVGDVTFQAHLAPVRDDRGEVTGLIGVAIDISERVRAEADRAVIEAELRQTQKLEAVGQLAGGVAHDFNNLLTVIAGHVELLSRRPPTDARMEASLKEIQRAQRSAASLTRQLLAFSRRQVLRPEVLDLNQVLRDVEKMMRRVIGEHIELVFELAEDLAAVEADPGQVEQVVLNLLVNARDAMPHGGRITVTTSNVSAADSGSPADGSGGHVALTVRDNGCGMANEVRERIFEPFFTTKPRGRGTGLGLSTVFGIVRQSAGQILCDSTPGVGSTFRIVLPATAVEARRAVAAAASAEVPRGTETVLLAEDDELVRELIEGILTDLGYQVLAARDGLAAERVAREHDGEIDMLLTDLVMPGQTGRDLAEQLRRDRPELPVLFMSGYADESMPGTPLLSPEDHFLSKPFDAASLGRSVREVLDGNG